MLAFLVPLVVRFVPEVLAWPYPIGFDTLIYANDILKGTYLTLGVAGVFQSTSLFYLIATAANGFIGDPLLTVKLLGPVLFSLLCGSLYVYSAKALRWGPWKALMVSFLAGTYFVSLRISWDLYRQMLGFIFLMIGLTALRLPSVKWRVPLVAVSGFLAVWSHELAAVLFFAILAVHFIAERERRFKGFVVLMAAPAFFIFLYQLHSPAVGSISVPFESVSAASSIDLAAFVSGFLAYAFVPLVPLAVLGALSFRKVDILSWLVAFLFFTYWPVFLPEFSMVWWFRWAILLVYPVVFLSVEGIERLWRFGKKLVWKFNVGRVLLLSLLLLNLAMSGYYLTSPPEHPIDYFGKWNNYKLFIQTSLLQNSVSISDTPSVVQAIKWLDEKVVGTDSVLVLHGAMDNWARVLIPRVEVIRVDEIKLSSQIRENAAVRMVQLAEEKAENGSKVYSVWWVDGKGWYGMPQLPPQFAEIQRFGNMGVFQYVQSDGT